MRMSRGWTVIHDLGEELFHLAIMGFVTVACWLAWAVPWPVWRLTAVGFGTIGMGLRGRTTLANVHHVRWDDPPRTLDAWWIATQQIANHLKTVISVLRLGQRASSTIDNLEVEGFAHLEPYLGRRGVIIVAPHAGPYTAVGLAVGPWFQRRGYLCEIAVIARLFWPFRSGALSSWFIQRLGEARITVIHANESPSRIARSLRRILKENGVLALFVDEPTPTPSATVPFFDSTIRLPLGPVRLARATGSVIVPCITTYGKAQHPHLTISAPIVPDPSAPLEADLERVAQALQSLVAPYVNQWSMLTPIWAEHQALMPPAGFSYADLHMHTPGSDGLYPVDDWYEAARSTGVGIIAVTDHDHLTTIRDWKQANGRPDDHVIPGVEITARGRIVHIGVLFPEAVPDNLPRPGTPLADVVRWARTVPGSLVVLVHPLPILWRRQLRHLARHDLLPDAMETRFPTALGRSALLERAAHRYGVATLGGTDAHLSPFQVGRYATLFAGETVEDLVTAIRERRTRAVQRPVQVAIPARVYVYQCLYSWLFPFRSLPTIERVRDRLLALARSAGPMPVSERALG